MIEWSLDAFRAVAAVRSIVVARPPGHERDLAGEDLVLVDGGATRSRSVANAMAAVETELVAIHDAARPLLTPALVEALVARLAADPEAAAVIPAAAVTDTIKRSANPPNPLRGSLGTDDVPKEPRNVEVGETLDRSRLWAAQTPQVFRAAALREALAVGEEARDAATDEAMLIERAGGRVLIHSSPAENFKVTTPHDLRVAELLLGQRISP